MDLALDTNVTPNQLLMGSGGHKNYVRMLNLTTGATIWDHFTPGDGQAVAMVGTSAIVGYHRNRPNGGAFAWPYYAAQLTASNGALGTWQAGLSGKPGQVTDGGNNGIRGFAYDPTANILVVVGAFTTYGASCDPATTITCTGGTKLNSIAAYAVTGGPPASSLPAAPAAPTVSAVTPTTAALSWPAVSLVPRRTRCSEPQPGPALRSRSRSASPATSFDDSGLTPGTEYGYQVVAANSAGSGPASRGDDVTTPLAATATALDVSPAGTPAEGSRLTLTATETAENGGSVSGTIEFTDKQTVLGSVVVPSSTGTATLTTPPLLPGTHSYRAAFTPDASSYGDSMSARHKLTVSKVALANLVAAEAHRAGTQAPRRRRQHREGPSRPLEPGGRVVPVSLVRRHPSDQGRDRPHPAGGGVLPGQAALVRGAGEAAALPRRRCSDQAADRQGVRPPPRLAAGPGRSAVTS